MSSRRFPVRPNRVYPRAHRRARLNGWYDDEQRTGYAKGLRALKGVELAAELDESYDEAMAYLEEINRGVTDFAVRAKEWGLVPKLTLLISGLEHELPDIPQSKYARKGASGSRSRAYLEALQLAAKTVLIEVFDTEASVWEDSAIEGMGDPYYYQRDSTGKDPDHPDPWEDSGVRVSLRPNPTQKRRNARKARRSR